MNLIRTIFTEGLDQDSTLLAARGRLSMSNFSIRIFTQIVVVFKNGTERVHKPQDSGLKQLLANVLENFVI